MAESAQGTSKLRINLNLLHPKEAPAKLPERFLKWLISYGRFIVIFVEIIVVGAFLMRFKLDADLDDLKKRINLDLPYVEGLANDEAWIRQTQDRLALIDKVYSKDERWQQVIVDLSEQMPQSIVFINLFLDGEEEGFVEFKVSGITLSNSDLAVFINNLRNLEDYRDIRLANIAFDRQEITFTITGKRILK